jgi:hypothetical protein
MKKKDYVYDALKILIDISKNAQDARPELEKSMGITSWSKEICTVRATTARAGGHTTAISRLINEDNMNLGVIFANYHSVKLFREKDNLSFCTTMKSYEEHLWGRRLDDLDGIVIDRAYLMSSKQQSDLYHMILPAICYKPKKHFFFIFLQ